MYNNSAETEELPPILHLTFYHPQGACVFLLLPEREKYHKFEGHKVVTLGRADSCTLRLNHKRVSREQLQIRAWRPRPDTIVSFEVVNTSKQPLQLNGTMVGYLCRSALSAKSLLTFGEFEVFINIENGEAQDSFALTCKDSDESSQVMFNISRLQPVNGDSIMLLIVVNNEKLVCTADDFKRSIIRGLEWLPHRAMSHKNMSSTLNV
uniref:TRAF-interacting protein with FHA domain-containing protein A n=1 Tax=Eptatretus burgeri TaxID=7764 RepID=A0A8C4QS70_EPTBU